MSWLVLSLVLRVSSAKDVRDEAAEVAEKLEAERAAFGALQSEKADLLVMLDLFERQARASTEQAAKLEQAAKRLDARLQLARHEEAEASAQLQAEQQVLAPRLKTLYRLLKQDRLSLLVSASGFASLMRRERSLRTLVRADLATLDDLQVVAGYLELQSGRLERLESAAATMLAAMQTEQKLAKARRARFDELVRSVSAEGNRSSRVVAELEKAEKDLTSMVGEMTSTASDSGFRARKGHLPFPAENGLIEVGFGKVVNPRFNTVIVQKGLDIRAALGAKVYSVGVGVVVFSGWLKGYGNLVIVDHGGSYHSLYAHLAHAEVEVDNEVEEGEELGVVGDTGSLKGSYLYFEVRKGGNAIDPVPWLEAAEGR